MPDIFEALILGLVQGLTEFLPISSSGHLVVVPALLDWDEPTLTFDLLLHAGTLVAVAWYFRRDLLDIVRSVLSPGDEQHDAPRRLLVLLVIATIPAAVAGLLFRDFFEDLFDEPLWVCAFWGVTAVGLAASEWRFRHAPQRPIAMGEALWIGLAQAAALAPGISRSGSTIAISLALGVRRPEAARFSFLLSIPAITGAILTTVPDVFGGGDFGIAVLAGFAVAMVSGYASIAALLRLVRTHSFLPFAGYLAVVAPLAALAL